MTGLGGKKSYFFFLTCSVTKSLMTLQKYDCLMCDHQPFVFLYSYASYLQVITNKLKEMYQMITLGGDAELELVDSLDPFSEGIVFR